MVNYPTPRHRARNDHLVRALDRGLSVAGAIEFADKQPFMCVRKERTDSQQGKQDKHALGMIARDSNDHDDQNAFREFDALTAEQKRLARIGITPNSYSPIHFSYLLLLGCSGLSRAFVSESALALASELQSTHNSITSSSIPAPQPTHDGITHVCLTPRLIPTPSRLSA